jgi:hypothetical protein
MSVRTWLLAITVAITVSVVMLVLRHPRSASSSPGDTGPAEAALVSGGYRSFRDLYRRAGIGSCARAGIGLFLEKCPNSETDLRFDHLNKD